MNRVVKKVSMLIGGIAVAAIGFQSCVSDPNSPGLEYMPDMARSPSLHAYQEYDRNPEHMEAQKPVEGSIARGYMPYMLPNTPEGYAEAANLKNALPYSEANLNKGKEIYGKFCIQCHGKKGEGDGAVAQNPKWPGPPPAYNGSLKNLPAGQIFHSITYGKGYMGSHASQLTQEERWKLVFYVQQLQGHDVAALYTTDNTNTENEGV